MKYKIVLFLLFTLVETILLANNISSATMIAGCTERSTDILQCNGTITGNIINSTTRSLWIHDAVITATQAGALGLFSARSDVGFINLSNVSITSSGASGGGYCGGGSACPSADGDDGCAGSNGIFNLTAKSWIKIYNSSIINKGGNGYVGETKGCDPADPSGCSGGNGGAGGQSISLITANDYVNITNSSFSIKAGDGGAGGGCSATSGTDPRCGGAGGSSDKSNFTIIANYTYFDNVNFDNSVGNGGDAGSSNEGGSSGGSGSTVYYNLYLGNSTNTISSFKSTKIINQGGSGGGGGGSGACGSGSGGKGSQYLFFEGFRFLFVNNSYNLINLTQGSSVGGSGTPTSKIEIFSNDTIEFGENTTLYSAILGSSNQLNFSNLIPKIKLFNTLMNNSFKLSCNNILNKLIIWITGRTDQSFDYGSCKYYNTTIEAEYNQPFPFFENNQSHTVKYNQSSQFNLTIKDNLDISCFRIALNDSTIFVNQSLNCYFSTTETSIDYSFNRTIPLKEGNVLGVQYWANDSQNWINISDIFVYSIETKFPAVNGSMNNSAPKINEIENITFNTTDNTELSFGQIIINDTGFKRYFNFSLDGVASAEFSQNFTIACNRGCYINLTARVNDSSNQFTQNETFVVVANTIPVTGNVSMTSLPLGSGNTAKGHWNYSDADGDLIVYNETYFEVNGTRPNDGINQTFLLGGNTTAGTNISFYARTYDGYNWSDWQHTSNASVGDIIPPTITNQSINGNSFSTLDTINLTVVFIDNVAVTSGFVVINSTQYAMTLIDTAVNLWSINPSLGLGFWNVSSFNASDGNENTKGNPSNFTFTVSNPPSGSPSGNTGGGANEPPTIIYLGEKLNCASSKINYTISNIQGSTFGGYTLVTDRKNTKPKCRDFLLQNNGNESITISLKCIDTGENLTTGFCRYVELQNNIITVPPNLFVQKAVTMCIKPLDENIEGDIFYFSIKSTDDRGLCASQLSNQILTGGFNRFLAKFVSFRKIGNLNYPLLLPAILLSLALFFMFYLIFKLLKLDVLGVIISLAVGFAAFMGYLAIM